MALRHILAAAGVVISVNSTGCVERVALYAAPTSLPSGANVDTRLAYLAGDRLYVETYFMNASSQPMRIDRDRFALRLANGRVLPRSVGTTSTHNLYLLEPGQGHAVFVDFHDDALRSATHATLIVGGVFAGTSLQPLPAGEIPLGGVPVAGPPPGPPEPPGPPAPPGPPEPPPPPPN